MAVLWLKFLTEIDENTTQVPQDLLDNPQTSKALENVEESAMTKEELWAYDDFWDKLGAERLLFIDSNKISREEGRAEGRAEGVEEGIAKQKAESAKKMLEKGLPIADIMLFTGLTEKQIEDLA